MQEILRDEFDDPEFLEFAIENYSGRFMSLAYETKQDLILFQRNSIYVLIGVG